MSAGKSYVAPFVVGEPMAGGVVAEVVASHSEALPVGSLVVGSLPWQEYSVADAKGLTRVPADKAPLSYFLGLLGMTGLTAYFGLLDIAPPKPGCRRFSPTVGMLVFKCPARSAKSSS